MRILQVKFKNLNSLTEEWSIDFTHPSYISSGIFAITGPTGAGKSTILDAICLALYGCTPRLGKITEKSNEIMARHTGECYAEVCFETQKGRFRCYWGQRRSREKSDGKLQDPKHEIANLDTGKLFETKKKSVAKYVEDVTGMNFQRFTRSILLAQGGFAAFLQADPGERAPILEQITGTEIYSKISTRVHKRQSEEKNTLDKLKAQLNSIQRLPEEEEVRLSTTLTQKQQTETTLNQQLTQLRTAHEWKKKVHLLEQQVKDLEIKKQQNVQQCLEFEPQKTRLEMSQRAFQLAAEHTHLTSLRIAQKDELITLNALKTALPEITSLNEESQKALQEAISTADSLKVAFKAEQELIKKVSGLDNQLLQQNNEHSRLKKLLQQTVERQQTQKDQLSQHLERRNALTAQLPSIESYLKDHAEDARLTSELSAIKKMLNDFHCLHQECSHLQALTGLHGNQTLAELDKALTILEKQQADIAIQLSHLEEQQQSLAHIWSFKEARDHLEDDKPCPLCGALEHPYALGNIPPLTEVNQALKNARKEQQVIYEQTLQTKVKKTELKKDLEQLHLSEKKLQLAQNTCLTHIRPFTHQELNVDSIGDILKQLKDKQNQWLRTTTLKENLNKDLLILDHTIQNSQNNILAIQDELQTYQSLLQKILETIHHLTTERHSLYQDKVVAEEEKKWEERQTQAETYREECRIRHNQAAKTLDEYKTKLALLEESTTKRASQLQDAEERFLAKRTLSGFEDEKSYVEAILPEQEHLQLQRKAETLRDQQLYLETTLKEKSSELASEKEKALSEQPLQLLVEQIAEADAQLAILREEVGILKERLLTNEKQKKAYAAIEKKHATQESIHNRWSSLDKLIGSADGKLYRNFAQGLTFEMMIDHANWQLAKMTDRYLLTPDPKTLLELNVIDKYQSDEKRTTKNLSGGESFLVSLALALGLSKMASSKVRVDSLFLDEGFGTLDDEALETALEALSNLQSDGKLIGVISHVQALKERISTQIQVIPQSGGRSTIVGPGCAKRLCVSP